MFLDPNLNSFLISIVAAIIIFEYHVIRKYEEKLNKLEERIRWLEYMIKEKESGKQ